MRLLSLIQHCLRSGNAFRNLRQVEQLRPITLGALQQSLCESSDLELSECFAGQEEDNKNVEAKDSDASFDSLSIEAASAAESSQSLEAEESDNAFPEVQLISEVTLDTLLGDSDDSLSCYTADDHDAMSLSSWPDCPVDITAAGMFQRPRGSSIQSTLPDIVEPVSSHATDTEEGLI